MPSAYLYLTMTSPSVKSREWPPASVTMTSSTSCPLVDERKVGNAHPQRAGLAPSVGTRRLLSSPTRAITRLHQSESLETLPEHARLRGVPGRLRTCSQEGDTRKVSDQRLRSYSNTETGTLPNKTKIASLNGRGSQSASGRKQPVAVAKSVTSSPIKRGAIAPYNTAMSNELLHMVGQFEIWRHVIPGKCISCISYNIHTSTN